MKQQKKPKRIAVGLIYKMHYPNGKIYIGQDRTNDIGYFGSVKRELIKADFPLWMRMEFTVKRTVLWYKKNTTIRELNEQERFFIEKFEATNPAVGYNQTKGCRKNESYRH